jgi:thiamine biosynthesis lipoprotein
LKPFRKTFFWCCLLMLALPAVQVRANWFSEDAQLMGTSVSVELWGEDEARSRQLIAAVLAEFQRLDLMMNPWNPASELARINREAGHAAVVTTPEILWVVERALHYSRLSEGAFDISFASVGQHYDYRQGRAPGAAVIARDRENIDYRAIELDQDAGSIRFAKAGLQVDLGGIAKGYAVDRGIDILRRAGVESAVISAGGDSRILGDLGDRPRTIGIRHPRNKNEYAVMIPLADTAISTSGDYERFFMQGEVRVHHILNPDTGRSAQGLQSASVLAPLAVDSDALSTTVFVLGVERGLQLVNSLPGVDAILIDGAGKLHYSAELLLSTRP